MKVYKYYLLYDGEIDPYITYHVDLPLYPVIIKSILVESSLPKNSMIEIIANRNEVVLNVPFSYIKAKWFPLDLKTSGIHDLCLKLTNTTKSKKPFKVFIAQEIKKEDLK